MAAINGDNINPLNMSFLGILDHDWLLGGDEAGRVALEKNFGRGRSIQASKHSRSLNQFFEKAFPTLYQFSQNEYPSSYQFFKNVYLTLYFMPKSCKSTKFLIYQNLQNRHFS